VSADERISLAAIAAAILRHRRAAVRSALVVFALSIPLTIIIPRRYEAKATFLPQGSQAGGSALAAAAAEFGFSFGESGGGSSPQFYVGLVGSDVVLRHLVTRGYPGIQGTGDKSRGADSVAPTLLDIWNVKEDSPEERVETGIEDLGDVLDARADRETGLVTLTVRDAQPEVARAILAAALDFVNVFNTKLRQSQAGSEARFVANRLEAARVELREAEGAVETFLTNNRGFSSSPKLQFALDRLQRELALRQDVVTSLAQAYDRARMDEVRNTPVITIVDPPRTPVKPWLNWLVLGPLLGLFGGLMLAAAVTLVLEWLWRQQATHPGDFKELNALARDAVGDLKVLMPGRRTGRAKASA
jgi:uncharacterized protein involved in exopolysaccharide biosynthesis